MSDEQSQDYVSDSSETEYEDVGYTTDEWYEDYEGGGELVFYACHLCKSKRGRLSIEVVTAIDYSRNPPGDSFYWDWHTDHYNLRKFLNDEGVILAIEFGRSMKVGSSVSWDEVDPVDDDEDEQPSDDDIAF